MKLIEPKVELIQQQHGLVGMYKHIERCARTCYKTEDSITENSYELLCHKLMKAKHFAMFEHGSVYLYLESNPTNVFDKYNYPQANFTAHYNWGDVVGRVYAKYSNNKYSKALSIMTKDNVHKVFITTNFRVILENHWEDDLEFICEPTEFHERRITLKFTTNIGVTREGNRHRVNSIAEESTRYCNYTNEKFNSGLNVCAPYWFSKEQIEKYENQHGHFELDEYMENILLNKPYNALSDIDYYLFAMYACEFSYNNLIRLGWSPQQAREVLPLATKSEVVYTAFASDWKHWFDLRLEGITGKPHPNMEQIAWLAQQELIKNNLWDLIYDPNNKKE